MVLLFDSEFAVRYGLREAILFHSICYWTVRNKANGTNYHDGRYWSYNSISAWSKMYPFLSEKQIRTTLDSLVNQGLLVKGNYNTSPLDRTSWYALSDLGERICPQGINAFALQGEPIPYKNTQEITYINKEKEIESTNVLSKEKENDDFNRFWSAYPKKKSKADAEKAFKKVKVPIEVLLNAIEKQKKSADWIKNGGQYIPYPATWLNGKRWEDEADTGFMNGHVHFDGTDVNHYEKIEDRSEDLNEW